MISRVSHSQDHHAHPHGWDRSEDKLGNQVKARIRQCTASRDTPRGSSGKDLSANAALEQEGKGGKQ